MTRDELYFSVVGVEPAPQGSKRHVGNGVMVESSKKVKPFREAVADAVFRAFVATGDDRTFTEPVVLWATFFMPKPRTVKRLLPSVPPDLDKMCRALFDGLEQNARVIESDSMIVRVHASKVYAAVPGDVGVRVAIKTVALAEATGDLFVTGSEKSLQDLHLLLNSD